MTGCFSPSQHGHRTHQTFQKIIMEEASPEPDISAAWTQLDGMGNVPASIHKSWHLRFSLQRCERWANGKLRLERRQSFRLWRGGNRTGRTPSHSHFANERNFCHYNCHPWSVSFGTECKTVWFRCFLWDGSKPRWLIFLQKRLSYCGLVCFPHAAHQNFPRYHIFLFTFHFIVPGYIYINWWKTDIIKRRNFTTQILLCSTVCRTVISNEK